MTVTKSTRSTRLQLVNAAGVDYDNSSSGLSATDVQEAIDDVAGGATSAFFVLDESQASSEGNVYNSWGDLYAALSGSPIGGLKIIELVGGASVPAGSYDLDQAILTGSTATPGSAQLDLLEGAVFNDLGGVYRGATLASQATATPPLRYAPKAPFNLLVIQRNANLISEGSVPLIEVEAGATLVISMVLGSTIKAPTGGASSTIELLGAGATLNLQLLNGATVEPDAIEGPAGSTLDVSYASFGLSFGAQSSFLGTLNEGGVSTFDDANKALLSGEGRFGPWVLSAGVVTPTGGVQTPSDKERLLYTGSTASSETFDAPGAPSDGTRFGLKNAESGLAASITVSGNGSDIEDPNAPGTYAASVVMRGPGAAVEWEYKSSTSQWHITSAFSPTQPPSYNEEDTSGGPAAFELPTLPAVAVGVVYIVKDGSDNAGTNNITVTTEGAELIDGNVLASIEVDGGCLQFRWSGTEWNIIAQV